MTAHIENLNKLNHDRRKKYLGKTEYAHVSMVEFLGEIYYKAHLHKYKWTKHFVDLRDAAKAVDLKLIEKGLKPKNILKEKS